MKTKKTTTKRQQNDENDEFLQKDYRFSPLSSARVFLLLPPPPKTSGRINVGRHSTSARATFLDRNVP